MSDIEYRPLGIERYVQVLRRRWRMITAFSIAGLLAAGMYLIVVGQSFTATTDVNINVISTDPFNAQRSASGLLDGTTEAQIATSNAVAKQAAQSLNDETTPADLRRSLDVSVVADATIIRISYQAGSPTSARAGADAVADSYLAYRATQAQTRLGAVIDRIDSRLAGLRTELGDANARAAAADGGTSDANQAASDRDLVVIEIDALLSQKNSLDLIDTAGGDILSSAVDNPVSVDPSRTIVLAIGALVGLVVGIMGAFAVAAFSRRLRTREDVERTTGVRPLFETSARIASIPESGDVLSELRVARERLFATVDPNGAVIAVVDDSRPGAPSDLPLNLALVAANSGQKTLLLLPGLTRIAAESLSARLALTLIDEADGVTTLTSRLEENLSVEFSSQLRQTDLESFDFSQSLRQRAVPDANVLVFVVLPPHAPHSVELATARMSNAVVAVLRMGQTRSDHLSATLEEFAYLSTPFIGALVSPRDRSLPVSAVGAPTPAIAEDESPAQTSKSWNRLVSGEGRNKDDNPSRSITGSSAAAPNPTARSTSRPAPTNRERLGEPNSATDVDVVDQKPSGVEKPVAARGSAGQRRVYASLKKQAPRAKVTGKDNPRRT